MAKVNTRAVRVNPADRFSYQTTGIFKKMLEDMLIFRNY